MGVGGRPGAGDGDKEKRGARPRPALSRPRGVGPQKSAPAETTLDLSARPGVRTYRVRPTDLSGRLVGTDTLAGGLKYPLALTGLAAGSCLLSVSGADAPGTPLRLAKRLTKEQARSLPLGGS